MVGWVLASIGRLCLLNRPERGREVLPTADLEVLDDVHHQQIEVAAAVQQHSEQPKDLLIQHDQR